jgi:multiple sugar transport system ATP-binding protein
MDGGRILQYGTANDLYERPANLAVARFIGTPSINLLPAEIDARGRASVFGQPIGVHAPGAAGPAMIGVRPEDLRVGVPGIAARLLHGERHGADRFDTFAPLADRTLRIVVRRSPGEAGACGDDVVSLGMVAERVHLFGGDGLRRPTRVTGEVPA